MITIIIKTYLAHSDFSYTVRHNSWQKFETNGGIGKIQLSHIGYNNQQTYNRAAWLLTHSNDYYFYAAGFLSPLGAVFGKHLAD